MSLSIFPLPAELLQKIFGEFFEYDITASGQKLGIKTLLIASHVCAFWRDAALGDSSLWAKALNPHSSNLHELKTTLSRTREAPLKITASMIGLRGQGGSRFDHSRWRLLFSERQMRRISALSLTIDHRKIEDIGVVDSMLSCEVPLLTFLRIQLKNCHFPWESDAGSPSRFHHFSPTSEALHGQALLLRHLTLSDCHIRYPVGCIFSNLLSLKITSSCRPLDSEAASYWLKAVASGSTPKLEALHITGLYNINGMPTEHSFGHRLPALKSLFPGYIRLEPLLGLLDNAEIPPSCSVNLIVEFSFDQPNVRTEKVESLVERVSRLWQQNTTPCTKLELEVEEDDRIRLSHHSDTRVISFGVYGLLLWDTSIPKDILRSISDPQHFPDISPDTCLLLDVYAKEPSSGDRTREAFANAFMDLMGRFSGLTSLHLKHYWVGFTATSFSLLYGKPAVWSKVMDIFATDLVLFPSVKHIRLSDIQDAEDRQLFLDALAGFVRNS